MPFLTKTELKTRSHAEIITAITRNDDSVVDTIIAENISYMKSYLRARYDTDAVFNATGTARSPVVLKVLKDLVVFDIYSSTNPVQITEVLTDSRTRLDDWLKDVQAGKINPDLPAALSADHNYVQAGTIKRRENNY